MYLLGGEQGLSLEFDTENDQWTQLVPPMSKYSGFWGCCAVVLAENMLMCGGGKHWDVIDEYNVEKNQWKGLNFSMPFQWSQFDSSVSAIHVQ